MRPSSAIPTSALPLLLGLAAAAALAAGCGGDAFEESEPNDSEAQADGPFGASVEIHGEIEHDNRDFFALDLPATTTLRVETEGRLDGDFCSGSHADLFLTPADGRWRLSGERNSRGCLVVTPDTHPEVAALPAGRYFVQVGWFGLSGFAGEYDARYKLFVEMSTPSE